MSDSEDERNAKKRKHEDDENDYQDTKKKKQNEPKSYAPLKKRFAQVEAEVDDEKEEGEEDQSSSEEEVDKYDAELFIDDADRDYLYSLPETKREAILFDRGEERKGIQERNRLKRERKLKQGKKIKIKSTTTNKKQSKTEKSKAAKDANKKQALQDLANRRKANTTKGREYKTKDDDDDDIYDDGDDESDDYDEEMDEDEEGEINTRTRSKRTFVEPPTPSIKSSSELTSSGGKKKRDVERHKRTQPPKELPKVLEDVPLEEFKKAQLTRDKIVRYFNEPFWETLVRGAYVRVGVGKDFQSDGQYVYRIAKVTKWSDLPKEIEVDGKQINKQLVLSIANSTKDMSIKYVSNSPITQEEYDSFKKLWRHAKSHQDMPTKEEIAKIAEQLQISNNYVYTHADINKIVEENQKKRAVRNFAKEKSLILLELETALSLAVDGDDTYKNKALELQEKLKELEEQQKASEAKSKYDLEKINEKNRDVNYVLEAQGPTEYHKHNKSGELNPFARRSTHANASWVNKLQQKSAAKQQQQQEVKKEEPKQEEIKKEEKIIASVAPILSGSNPTSVWNSLDLDLEQPKPAISYTPPPVQKVTNNQPTKKGLSVADYLNKRNTNGR